MGWRTKYSSVTVSWPVILYNGNQDERSRSHRSADRCVPVSTRKVSVANLWQGEQLESVHQHRERAKAAHDLIDYYNQFSRDEISRLDALKKEGKEGRRQVAVILRRLVIVAKEVDLPYAEKVTQPPSYRWLFDDK